MPKLSMGMFATYWAVTDAPGGMLVAMPKAMFATCLEWSPDPLAAGEKSAVDDNGHDVPRWSDRRPGRQTGA